ncbi:MAG: protein phosphatase 2C domain-containing protein [Hamadaea sp.]|nr:protein phosphatase 2C domain-containing protein [Hamadaea sp.]
MRWAGADGQSLDRPQVVAHGPMVLGRYGGRVDAGAHKNEDAAFLLHGPGWEFAVVADGHAGADSAALAVTLLEADTELPALLDLPVEEALGAVRTHLVELLLSADTSHLTGETAVLAVARKDRFALWVCVGDCVAYALHPELHRLGQHALNQRAFFEWFGRVDSLRLPVPSFATGVHALRPGRTRLALVTDGLLEFGPRVYADGAHLFADLYDGEVVDGVQQLLQAVHDGRGVDSATVVAWDVEAGPTPIRPSG